LAEGEAMRAGSNHSSTVALTLERKADLSQDRVRQALTATAQELGRKRARPEYGAGLVDAYRAILSLVRAAGETTGRVIPAASRQ
jgi:hypothetical protein